MSRKILTLLAAALLTLVLLPGGVLADGPTAEIDYAGNVTLLPGEDVVLCGYGLEVFTTAEMYRVEDDPAGKPGEPEWSGRGAKRCRIRQNTGRSLKCRIPASFSEGIYRLRLSGAGEQRITVNAPVVRFTVGDSGQTASPGGWIRIQGENLSLDAAGVRVTLSSGEQTQVCAAETIDAYSLRVVLPAELPIGEYTLTVYNGRGDGTCQSTPVTVKIAPSAQSTWPQEVFIVTDYTDDPADGNARFNYAFQAALDAAAANGGGVVLFPAGRYLLTNSFTIPEKTVVRGASQEETLLFWTSFTWSLNELPDYILKSSGQCALRELTVSGARIGRFLVADGDGITVEKCRFHFDSFGGAPTLGGQGDAYVFDGITKELEEHRSDILVCSGKNIRIENCEILSSGRPLVLTGAENVFLREVKLPPNNLYRASMAALTGLECAVIEDVTWNDTGVQLSGSRIYFARGSWEDNMGGERETVVLDGDGTAYEQVIFSALDLYNTGALRLGGGGKNLIVDGVRLRRSSGIVADTTGGDIQYLSIVGTTVSDSQWFKYYGVADGENRCTVLSLTGNGTAVGIALRRDTLTQGAFIDLSGQEMDGVLVQDAHIDGAETALVGADGERSWNGVLLSGVACRAVREKFDERLTAAGAQIERNCGVPIWGWIAGAAVVAAAVGAALLCVLRKKRG